MKPIFVIMVTYRRFDYFKRTIESLVPTLPPKSAILVVDNHSNDKQTEEYLRKEFPLFCDAHTIGFHVLLSDKNDGWGRAMNEGLRLFQEWKKFEYVLETNNDVLYSLGWSEKAHALMEKYPQIGLLGLWNHINHGVMQDFGDMVQKDQMPAVAWLFRSADLQTFLPFAEKGPTKMRGGIGEDIDMCLKVSAKGYIVAGAKPDLAQHMDGYDTKAGQTNEAYET